MWLDALEGLFDAPAGVIQITKAFGREVAGLQMGGQQARLAGGGDMAHQSHLWRCRKHTNQEAR